MWAAWSESKDVSVFLEEEDITSFQSAIPNGKPFCVWATYDRVTQSISPYVSLVRPSPEQVAARFKPEEVKPKEVQDVD